MISFIARQSMAGRKNCIEILGIWKEVSKDINTRLQVFFDKGWLNQRRKCIKSSAQSLGMSVIKGTEFFVL